MTLEFLSEARAEFHHAALYYEEREQGLGLRFRDEIREVCLAILAHPMMWRERDGGYRRVNCPIFPYYISYFIRGDKVIVAAIAHGSRHPDYWKKRLE